MTDSIAPTPSNATFPANEPERLAALYRYHILDTSAETAFDRVTSLAARLFKMPTVLISLVDESRAWFKSSIGFDASEVPRDATICSFAILTDEPLIVPDTQLDERFACNPFVLCEPGLRFYAGAPLLTHDGFNLGTLCLLDSVPREPLTAEQEATLVDLAAIVVDELELKLAAQQIAKVDAALLEVTQGVATVTGDAFAEALVLQFAKVLGVDYVYIGLIEGDEPKRCALVGFPDVKSGCAPRGFPAQGSAPSSATRQMMRTIATCARGRIVDNLEYSLQDTPCWEAILHGRGSANEQRRICCYPRNVQANFPHAPLLKSLAVESYVATPFCDARGEVLGVLGVMDGKPLENVHLAASLLTIFADRIATEIERQQTERDLRESQVLAQSQLLEIEAIYQTAPVGLAILDADLRYQRLNQKLAEINGIAIEDHIGRTVREIVPDLADEVEPLFRRVLETGAPLLNVEISGETNAQPGVCRTWIENWYPLTDETGRRNGINIVVQEITDRKRTESILVEQTRLLEAISADRPLDESLAAVCESVATLSPQTRACVLLCDDRRSKFVRSITPDFPPSFGQGLIDAPIDELAIGTCGMAVDGGEPVICTDIATDQRWSPAWREVCIEHGILACYSAPAIGSDGLPWGSLMLCFDEARMPTDWERQLAEFGTQIVTIALERDRLHSSLRESEERLSLAIVGAEMVTWDVDLVTGKTIWSVEHFRLFGYEPVADGVATLDMWESRLHPEDLAAAKQEWRHAQQERLPYNSEYRIVRADDGRVVWLAATGRFIYNSSGRALRFVGVKFDITDRKIAELEIHRLNRDLAFQADELQTILDTIPVGVAISDDPHCNVIRSNRCAQTMLGVSADTNVSATGAAAATLPFRQFRNGVEIPADRLPMQLATAQGQPVRDVEIQVVRSDGTTFDWWVNAIPLFDDRSAVRGCVAALMDVSELRNTEAKLREREAELRQAQRLGKLGNWYWDAQTDVVTGSAELLRIYGFDPDLDTMPNFIAQNGSMYPDASWQSIARHVRQALETGISYELDVQAFRHHTPIWVAVCGEVVRDTQGQIVGLRGTAQDITERKIAEASLEQSNARFQAAMRAVEGIVFEWNLHTQTVYRSEGLFDLLGIRTEAAPPTAEWWRERVHPDDLSRIESELPPHFAGIERYECEYRVRHEAGHWVYVWERSYFQYDSQGELVSVVGFTADISRRKQIEADLRQSQEIAQRQLMEIEAIYQTAPIGLTILDADLRFERVNQRLAEINGISIAEHIGRTVSEIVPDVSKQNEPLLRQVLATGEPLLNVELSGETPAQPGVYRTWIENCYPFKDETGRSVGINVVVQEITDRKIAETALQQSKAQLEFLLEAAEFGDWDLNLADLTAYRSLRHDRIFGYETLLPAWTYEMFLDHVLPEDRHRADLNYQNAIDNHQPWNFECRIRRADGQVRWIWVSGYVYHNAAGESSRMLGLVADITDRKRAEAALTERNQELDSFVHIVSHDLKAPLRAISNLSQWIEDDLEDRLPPDNQQQFQLLRDRVKRMESMIDSLLMYARAGRQQAPTESFNVADLLDEILDSLPIPPSFTITIAPPLPTLNTNRLFLSQVLTNLISNAVKHHPSADGHLDIAAIDRGDYYEFILKDDGAGIAPENHAQIFTIFQTLKSKDNTDSTGVGLSIVKKIVETEGGTIRLESSLGAGTTFYVTWPKIHT